MIRFFRFIFTTSLILAFASLTSVYIRAQMDAESIAGMWLFDEGSGDTAFDSSNKGNDGEIVGAEWVDGYVGKGLRFDGTSSYVDLGDDASLNLVDTLTLTAWIKHETGNDGYVIMRNDESDLRQYSIIDYPGNDKAITCHATTSDGRLSFFHGGAAVDDNEWHHLAAVYDSPSVTVYVDGVVQENTGTTKELGGPMVSAETTTLIGKRKPSDFLYKGVIDEVAIFNIALSQDDIKRIMNNGLSNVLAVSSAGKLACSWGRIKT